MVRLPHRTTRTILRCLMTLVISLCLGWVSAQWLEPPVVATTISSSNNSSNPSIGTVDPVTDRYERGQSRYQESCATCHIAIPPAVLPIQTWQILIQDKEHYGVTIDLPQNANRKLIWSYLSTFSRSLRTDEDTPFRIGQARHFKALHPQVKLPPNVTIATCATCHPKADVFNFRELLEQ
jgi:Dihaem cytochrome c